MARLYDRKTVTIIVTVICKKRKMVLFHKREIETVKVTIVSLMGLHSIIIILSCMAEVASTTITSWHTVNYYYYY